MEPGSFAPQSKVNNEIQGLISSNFTYRWVYRGYRDLTFCPRVGKSTNMYIDTVPSSDVKYTLAALNVGLLDMRTINHHTHVFIAS